jgi:glycosyltransferase involved in cell wall biosynthesis
VRILQLTSDWKWTGPAEPMLRLAETLRARGHDVAMGHPEPPAGAADSLAARARAAGFASAVALERRRGAHPIADRADVRRLREALERERFDVVHCWHTRDHLLAWRARRAARAGAAIVRSQREAERIPRRPWNRWLFGPAADGLLCVSPGTARANASLRGGRPIAGVFGAVDLERFQPAPGDPRVRTALGLAPEHEVVGIVARVQPQRRFDLLLAAAQCLFAERPAARLLVIGRGTRRAEVAEEPARRLGIADRVVFAGHRGADYPDVLHAIDVFTFLVPGTDGTCRALLEAAACGIPAVTTRRGALAEIVADGETGLVADEAPAALARAWSSLLADAGLRAKLAAAARQRAERCFAPERLGDAVLALYAETRRGEGAARRPRRCDAAKSSSRQAAAGPAGGSGTGAPGSIRSGSSPVARKSGPSTPCRPFGELSRIGWSLGSSNR